MRSADRPLVLSGERGTTAGGARRQQRFVALAFGLAESDLPLRVAFPLFMTNTLRWLAGRTAEDLAGGTSAPGATLRAGETLRVAAGETLWTRPQRTGGDFGPVRPLPDPWPPAETLRGPAVYQPLQNGFYLLRGSEGGDRWLAVNTDDPRMAQLNAPASAESGGTPAVVVTTEIRPTRGVWADIARGWPPWVWLAAGAFLFSVLEWGLFHRRQTE